MAEMWCQRAMQVDRLNFTFYMKENRSANASWHAAGKNTEGESSISCNKYSHPLCLELPS